MNENIRLPKIAIPHRYEINLDINLDEFSYTGKEVVFLEIVDETKELQLHSLGIVVENAFVSFEISCSKGTYIRSIARDLGDKLGCGGHLVELVRLSQGKFELKDAKKVDDVQMSDLINMEDLSF